MSRELHIVGFQMGRETYGVPITSLHEIVRVPEITAVPDAPDYLEGVINLGEKSSRSWTCASALARSTPNSKDGTGFWWWNIRAGWLGSSSIRPLRWLKIPSEDVEAPPAVFQEGGLNCVTGLGKVQGRLIVLLDMNKLLAPASLLQESGKAEQQDS